MDNLRGEAGINTELELVIVAEVAIGWLEFDRENNGCWTEADDDSEEDATRC